MMIPAAKYRHIIIYSISLSAMLLLLRWMQWKFLIVDNAIEIYIGLIAAVFTFLGIWIAMKLTKPKVTTVVVEKEVYISNSEINQIELEKLQLRPRELEVLQMMSLGMSNTEIAEKLFISLSTVKTHASRLFDKMEVKSRTQAIEKAKRIGIIR